MPVRLDHIVVDAHDPAGLARFWTRALGSKVLSERANEIVIGTGENAPVGMCFMPVTDPKTVKNRMHLDLISSAADRDQEIGRPAAPGIAPGPAFGPPAAVPVTAARVSPPLASTSAAAALFAARRDGAGDDIAASPQRKRSVPAFCTARS